MKKFLLLFFSGFTTMAVAQSEKSNATGTNADAAAPVNVSAPALRPAQPAMFESVPVKNHGQFYVVGDKPATPSGQIITSTPVQPISKEEIMRRSEGAASPGNKAVTGQKPAKSAGSSTQATQKNKIPGNGKTAKPSGSR